MSTPVDAPHAALLARGMSRRAFLRFASAMTAALALPGSYAPRIAAAVASAPRIPVIWLRGQDCGGNSRALLGASSPTIAQLMLDLLSIEYHESLMGQAGAAADQSRTDAMERYPNGYIAVVEGAIPTAGDGMACTVAGRPIRDIVREVCDGSVATIAVGSCAFDGGLAAAAGGSTGAVGVGSVAGDRLVSLPGCPINVENLTATIVHYLTFKQMPVTDSLHRPLFAYGGLLHNQCERRAHFEFGEFATAWGDEASQKGWCLYKVGCKGPETFANCPTVLYAERTSWAVKAGHGCVGCTMPRFWDAMGPAYRRLPSPIQFASEVTADQAGAALLGGVAALTVAHGAATYVRERRTRGAERRKVLAAAGAVGVAEAAPQMAAPPSGEARTAEAATTEAPTAEPPSSETAEAAVQPPAPDTEPSGPQDAPGREVD